MSAIIRPGMISSKMKRDTDGHREYTVTHKVELTDYRDSAAVAAQCPGLPLPGSQYAFGNDLDVYAYCRQMMEVTPLEGETGPSKWYMISQVFSTKDDRKRCKDIQIEDPLLTPDRISGSTVNYQEEANHDHSGNLIKNSAHELVRGPQVEFNANKHQIVVEGNRAFLNLETIAPMVNCVNDRVIWGAPVRCVQLSGWTWEKKFYGACYSYYTHKWTFDVFIKYVSEKDLGLGTGTALDILKSGHDRIIADEGARCIRGRWETDPASVQFGRYVVSPLPDGTMPNVNNPANFIRFKDFNGENTRTQLNGSGYPVDSDELSTAGTSVDQYGRIIVEYYDEANFLSLGLPTTL